MRAAIYIRISDDREGERLGVTRQREDCTALAARLGAEVYDVYEDNDIGASTRSKKPRPRYLRLLADAKAGVFDVVVAYSSSRLTRRPREHEDLIELATEHAIRFEYVASPSFDLNFADGRQVARMLAAADAGEAERNAERVSRAARQRAEKGEWHGGRHAYGFTYGQEHDPIEAPRLREAAERLLAGESLYGICTEWATRDGRAWFPKTLKRLVTSPTVAGYREIDGKTFTATWAPIIDRDDWKRLCVLLRAPERQARGFHNGNARKYMLSGLVFCGTCEHVMVSMSGRRPSGDQLLLRHAFTCSKISTGGTGLACGSMRIEMPHLERYIEAQVFTRLDSPELRAAIAATADDIDDTEQQLRTAIEADEARIVRLTAEYDDDEMTKAEYRSRRDRLELRLNGNRDELSRVTRARVHTRLPDIGEIKKVWSDKDVVWKRTILSSVIQRIEISRHPAGVASNLTPRRAEDPAAFATRLDLHRAGILRERVRVTWWF